MKMPRVHHEISMKISWVIFPKSDFGMTVLIGVSQFQPTALHEQASISTAPSRQARDQSKRRRGRGEVADGIVTWRAPLSAGSPPTGSAPPSPRPRAGGRRP